MKNWAIVPLRIGLAVIFIAHGLQKTFGLFGGSGISGFTGLLEKLGFMPAQLWAYIAAGTELLGGICLLLGFGTRIAAAFIFILMIVATLKVHLSKGLFLAQGGFEYNLLIISVCISLMLAGPGKLSLTKKY